MENALKHLKKGMPNKEGGHFNGIWKLAKERYPYFGDFKPIPSANDFMISHVVLADAKPFPAGAPPVTGGNLERIF